MNSQIQQFYIPTKDNFFKEVLFLIEKPKLKWEDVSRMAFDLPRGWYELSRVSSKDRVEFTRDFWLDRIPYHPRAHPAIFEFFERLDDVLVVLTRKMENEPMDSELVYSLKGNSSFFRGKPPCSDAGLLEIHTEIGVNLPRDYLSFLKIHNGFGKLSEMGVLEAQDLANAKRRVVELLLQTDQRVRSGNLDVDPGSLIPFFEALGLSSFQCFYADWYPGGEMGNVYLSGIDYTISDITQKRSWIENLAFPVFSEWLAYYLQGMDLCT